MNVSIKLTSIYFLTATLVLTPFSCKDVSDYMDKWRKESFKKRYNIDLDKRGQIADWEKEVKEYEKVINEKVSAGIKTARVYRKIGEAYGTMNAYGPCIENLQKSIDNGNTTPDVFYSMGLCQGNFARVNNWNRDMALAAEQSFLKSLSVNPDYEKAKFELGLIYFFGFGSNNKYSVLSEVVTVTQDEYRKKGLKLMQEYQNKIAFDPQCYFALANMYKTLGNTGAALSQMESLVNMLKSKYRTTYKNSPEYKNALNNINILKAQVSAGH